MSNTNENQSVAKTNINWYPGHMAKTKRLIIENLDNIDIVLEVIDARMPFSSKIPNLDDYIVNKKTILVMTKYDLCDSIETNKWIKYYKEKGYYVLAYNLEKTSNLEPLYNIIEEIMTPINLKRKEKGLLKKRARLLVVGIPNAGKSTLINRIVKKKATEVGNKPGVTKQVSWIRINENLELLDTPGILWPKIDNQIVGLNLASFTAIKEEILPLEDVVEYILRTLEKYYPHLLKERYGIDHINDDLYESLTLIGKKRGCLIKGGNVDYEKVITLIINDIKQGIIKNITFDRFNEVVGNNNEE